MPHPDTFRLYVSVGGKRLALTLPHGATTATLHRTICEQASLREGTFQVTYGPEATPLLMDDPPTSPAPLAGLPIAAGDTLEAVVLGSALARHALGERGISPEHYLSQFRYLVSDWIRCRSNHGGSGAILSLIAAANPEGLGELATSLLPECAAHACLPCMEFLLEAGGDCLARSPDSQDDTLLHCVDHRGMDAVDLSDTSSSPAADFLIEQGCDVDARNALGQTPLHVAAHRGHVSTMLSLYNGGASLAAVDSVGRTPLHSAAAKGCSFYVRCAALNMLVAWGCDVNAADVQGMTPLLCAAQTGTRYAVASLLANGASAVVADNDGRNVFLHACRGAKGGVLQMLADHGADMHGVDNAGHGGWDHAQDSPMRIRDKADTLCVLQSLGVGAPGRGGGCASFNEARDAGRRWCAGGPPLVAPGFPAPGRRQGSDVAVGKRADGRLEGYGPYGADHHPCPSQCLVQ